MRTRSIVLGIAASLVAGTITIATTSTSSDVVDSSSNATPVRTARVVLPNRPAPMADPGIDRLLGDLRHGRGDPQAVHEALVEALRRDPAGTLAVLEQFLADANPQQQATRTVVGALVTVGTPDVQVALVELVGARVDDTAFVKLVVPSLGFLAKPTVGTEVAVRALTAESAPEATRTSAHLTLGIMASRFTDGDAPRGAAIVQGYAARLAVAQTDAERRSWLSVLGNAGTPAAATAIVTQLDTADPILRGRALEALRRVESPDADARLVHALDDGDARVRTSAAWSLSYRQPTPETLRAMLGRLAGELDAQVATTLLDAIWARREADLDAVRTTVRSVADHHASQAVRSRARSLLVETI